MLVLSRKCDRSFEKYITITASNGETMDIHVVDIRGEQVRLGFEGDMAVLRSELEPVPSPAAEEGTNG